MTKQYLDEMLKDENFERELERESLIISVSEAVHILLAKLNLSRRELANKLHISKPRVTKMLDGSSNMTLRTLADIATAVNYVVKIEFVPKHATSWLNVVPTSQEKTVTSLHTAANDATKIWQQTKAAA